MTDFDKLPPECNVLCEWRPCLHKGYDKGPYSQGRGYTSYYANPIYVCMTRMQHGCPIHRDLKADEMLKALSEEIALTKASVKAKKLLFKLHKIISLLGGSIDD